MRFNRQTLKTLLKSYSLTTGQHSSPSENIDDDDDPFDFDELDQTLDLSNPLDDLEDMPEPNNVHRQTEDETLEALFDEFDNLDDLDDFGSADDDVGLISTKFPNLRLPSPIIHPPNGDTISEDWSDVDLDSWLDDVPEPANLADGNTESPSAEVVQQILPILPTTSMMIGSLMLKAFR